MRISSHAQLADILRASGRSIPIEGAPEPALSAVEGPSHLGTGEATDLTERFIANAPTDALYRPLPDEQPNRKQDRYTQTWPLRHADSNE
jgi:hypothetical protein